MATKRKLWEIGNYVKNREHQNQVEPLHKMIPSTCERGLETNDGV